MCAVSVFSGLFRLAQDAKIPTVSRSEGGAKAMRVASLRERSRVLNADKIMQNGRILLIFSTFSSFYLRMCEIICNFAPAFCRLCADGARKLHNIKYLKQKTKQNDYRTSKRRREHREST